MRYAFTSGIPDPAAAGAMKAQSAAAAAAKTILIPAYATKASRYLYLNYYSVRIISTRMCSVNW